MFVARVRRGLAQEWEDANPVLADGEVGFESDTKKLKIGDGLTDWINLSYVVEGPEGPTGPQGPKGPGVVIKGIVATSANLPASGGSNDVYIAQDTLNGWMWNGSSWVNVGPLQGPQGIQGIQGPPGNNGTNGAKGDKGDTGDAGQWWSGTKAAYDAIAVKDPNTLYVTIG